MSARTGARRTAAAVAAAVATLGTRAAAAQPLASRVGGADGPVVLTFATREAACGDGRDLVAFGDRFSIGGNYSRTFGGGWTRTPCVHGPATVTFTLHGGAVTDVRVRVGPPSAAATARDAAGARALGPVPAADAAAYFLDVARRATGRDGERAVLAAALADSADVWRPLLALARGHADDRVARAAVQWLGTTATPDAVPSVAALLRDGTARPALREGAVVGLALAPNGIGEPALETVARGVAAAGGDDPRTRDRAVFWLGNTGDPRARAALRTLAAADTAPEAVRAQAIFTLGHVDRRDDDPEPNVAFLRALYPSLTSTHLQDRVVQSVAQAEDAASRRWLLDLAADARQSLAARKQALFWAGQQRDRPIGELLGVDARLTGTELRRQYAFVLSQRDEDAAVDRLIAMAHTDADAAVRRQAIFWLGQSKSPRARTYLESVVTQ